MKYTATQWDTEADKEKFVRQFKAFVESDFAKSKFPKWFYTRLSMTFGHIAHYNQGGFYETFFGNLADKVCFLEQTLQCGCYGSPAFTYCDCEREIQEWLQAQGTLEKYQAQFSAAAEASERATMARLNLKYATA